MNPKVLLFSVIFAIGIVGSQAGRMFILDDGDFEQLQYRVRREEPKSAPIIVPALANKKPLEFNPIPTYGDLEEAGSDSYGHGGGGGGYKEGRVGPVYTFVKTDPYAHVKWGVRHVAGYQYGR